MITCAKDFQIVISSGVCESNSPGATPNTLVKVGSGSRGQITILPVTNPVWWPVQWPGHYHINYVSGFLSFHQNSISGEPPCDGAFTGTSGISSDYQVVITHFYPGFGSYLFGANCCLNGGGCDTGALTSATSGANPVNQPYLPSIIFSQAGPYSEQDVTLGAYPVLFRAQQSFTGGSITYELFQDLTIYDQPERIRIRDYATVGPQLVPDGGTCPDFEAFAYEEWDGTFPTRYMFYPSGANNQVYWKPLGYTGGSEERRYAINGKVMAFNISYETAIAYRSVAGVGYWELRIIMYVQDAYIQSMWLGKKFTGTDPTGPYDISLADSCGVGPAVICVEAY